MPYETLAKMNGAAAEQYSAAADVAGALADFSISLKVWLRKKQLASACAGFRLRVPVLRCSGCSA